MGVSIHYALQVGDLRPERAREVVETMARIGRDAGFAQVGAVEHLVGPKCRVDNEPDPDRGWMLIQAQRTVDGQPPQAPDEMFVVHTRPGAGCEPAYFGLRRFAGDPGWSWKSWCKTHYASDKEAGGIKNFMRCHTALVLMLTAVKKSGIKVEVSDETGFWDHRDRKRLTEAIVTARAALALFDGLSR